MRKSYFRFVLNNICFVGVSYLYLYLRILVPNTISIWDVCIVWQSTGVTCGAGTVNCSGAPCSFPVFSGDRTALVFGVVFCRSFFFIFFWSFVIVLDDLRFLITLLVCTNLSYCQNSRGLLKELCAEFWHSIFLKEVIIFISFKCCYICCAMHKIKNTQKYMTTRFPFLTLQ